MPGPPASLEERALAQVRRAVEKDLLRGRPPAEIVRGLLKGGLRRVEAEDIVARAQRTLPAGRAPSEVPARPPAPIPLVPARTAVPPRRPRPAAPRRPGWRAVLVTAVLVSLAAGGVLLGPDWIAQRTLTRNERQALDDLRALASANVDLAPLNGGAFAPPEALADPARRPPGASGLAPRFAEERRSGYVFQFYGDQPVDGAATRPAYRAYAYVARPAEPGRTGRRSFALYSYLPHVHVREDGTPPTVEDAVIASR